MFFCGFFGVFLFSFVAFVVFLVFFYIRSRLRDIGHLEPELPKKVAALQHCRQEKNKFFILKYKFAIFKGNTEPVR